LGAFIPIISILVVLSVIFAIVKVNMARRRRNGEASNQHQELTAAPPGERFDNRGIDNRSQSSNAPGTGKVQRAQRRLPESSTHSMPAYTKKPGEPEQNILQLVSDIWYLSEPGLMGWQYFQATDRSIPSLKRSAEAQEIFNNFGEHPLPHLSTFLLMSTIWLRILHPQVPLQTPIDL
jgi:hypothetical protein